ncbi:SAM-dependent methyltransferase [Labedaea rhizosphaerae]|uniref:Cyclopropane-fatty-acyl-phospholipid synthase n=1 Tax=Labedaea rhizosphaerae TaxID=598644 RepID=A0A4R6S5H3_LABRH|nr:cyclopropane-fatty-acyl-phospholipid synthase family protein [Labedaea rhizosphaerae]TDP95002.1 cyclopropane-fatty-acyl-phospholipid synthase [Labedaea rhizosphaerae]
MVSTHDRAPGAAQRIANAVTEVLGAPPPVRVRAWDGSVAGPEDGPELVLRSRRAVRHVLWRPGELGLARAYVSGDLDVEGDLQEGLRRAWSAPHRSLTLPAVLRAAAAGLRLGLAGPRPKVPAQEARLRGRLHTQRRDKDAIAHHYDLGNDFYRLVLDETMSYSCGWYRTDSDTLLDAQRAKLDLVCRGLGLRAGMRLLDVGCGWGALVLHAAREYGVRATGVTLSKQQHAFVTARAAELGVADRVTVELRDYRDVRAEPFDAVASIEMGEHVGEGNYAEYLAVLRRAVKPGGPVVLQQMSRGGAPGGGAFIERYIAPDMTMRPLPKTLTHLENAGFEIQRVRAMRTHYARTIDAWAAELERNWDEVVATVGVGWARVWRLYLAGAALAFADNRMGVDQILVTSPA